MTFSKRLTGQHISDISLAETIGAEGNRILGNYVKLEKNKHQKYS